MYQPQAIAWDFNDGDEEAYAADARLSIRVHPQQFAKPDLHAELQHLKYML